MGQNIKITEVHEIGMFEALAFDARRVDIKNDDACEEYFDDVAEQLEVGVISAEMVDYLTRLLYDRR